MKLRPLGFTGLMVSEIGLGTITFGGACDENTSLTLLDLAYDSGINWIDIADAYPSPGPEGSQGMSEQIIGRWLKSRSRRAGVLIASKAGKAILPGFGGRGLSRKHLVSACEGSLKRLGTDYLDLYLLHAPDPQTPFEETVRTLDDLVRQGKVRYTRVSNFSASRLSDGLKIAEDLNLTRFSIVQSRYNLFVRDIENDLLPLCQREGLGVTVYNPLAAGLLSGKYQFNSAPAIGRFADSESFYRHAYWQKPIFEGVETLRSIFGQRNIPLAQVALAWLRQRPGISSVVLGATSARQLEESLGACTLELSPEEIAVCEGLVERLPQDLKCRTTDR